MTQNVARMRQIAHALTQANVDALLCSLPTNVLLLSGYWPVVGNSVALVTRDGRCTVIAPEDEYDLARRGWADSIVSFQPGSLTEITNAEKALPEPLAEVAQTLGIRHGRIAYEGGGMYEPAPYSAMHLFGLALLPVLYAALPQATLISSAELIVRLRAIMTSDEQERVRVACQVAGLAFVIGKDRLRVGLTETEAAAHFRTPLSTQGVGYKNAVRADGFAWCMSGPNAAFAGAAYARSRAREIVPGDFVLIHCNSFVDGYWTDITRTYCMGEPTHRQRDIYEAIFAARAAALHAIHPGVTGAEVDKAARDVLVTHGFGPYFTHGLGHSVGFSVINGDAPPRLHPASRDRLEVGMVFNVEPAIYIEGYGGVRQCDVVAITENAVEVLTPFHTDIADMGIPGAEKHKVSHGVV